MSGWGHQRGLSGGYGWFSGGVDYFSSRESFDPTSRSTYDGMDILLPAWGMGLEAHSADFGYSWVTEYGNLRDLCSELN